jgi:hypothetical protein
MSQPFRQFFTLLAVVLFGAGGTDVPAHPKIEAALVRCLLIPM